MNEKHRPNWDDIALFITVAREGGLSGAARKTGQSAATIGRHMRRLEQQLGSDLFLRGESGYELTQEAANWLEELALIEGRLSQSLMQFRPNTRHTVKIAAGTWTSHYLAQNISVFRDLFETIRLQILSNEERVSLLHRETDIAIRNQRPTERGLAGRKLRKIEFAV